MRTITEDLLSFYSDPTYAKATIGSVDELGFYALIKAPSEIRQRIDLRDGLNHPEWDSTPSDDLLVENLWYVVLHTSSGFISFLSHTDEGDAESLWMDVEDMYSDFDGEPCDE